MSTQTPFYDSHCHLLNGNYLTDEIHDIFQRHLADAIEPHPGKKGLYRPKAPEQNGSFIDQIALVLHWIAEVAKNLAGIPQSSMEILSSAASKVLSIDPSNINIVPLMMDITFMFDKPLNGPQGDEDSEMGNLDRIEKILGRCRFPSSISLDDARNCLHRNYRRARAQKLRPGLFSCPHDGFGDQIKALKGIVAKNNTKRQGLVMPFLAVDPRRDGIIDTMKSLVDPVKGPFFGVKLYPRLGVHPQCPQLDVVYEFCAENDVPITTHAAPGGFPVEDWVYRDWSDPALFEPALKKMRDSGRDLRINFAHFGMSHGYTSTEFPWAETIVRLMREYPGVYSDLACYTDIRDIKTFLNTVWKDHRDIAVERTMFGTDFDIIYFADTLGIDMETYFRQFEDHVPADDLNTMRSVIPKRFLKLS